MALLRKVSWGVGGVPLKLLKSSRPSRPSTGEDSPSMMPPSGMVVLPGLNVDGELLFRKQKDVSGSLTQPAHISLVNFECKQTSTF